MTTVSNLSDAGKTSLVAATYASGMIFARKRFSERFKSQVVFVVVLGNVHGGNRFKPIAQKRGQLIGRLCVRKVSAVGRDALLDHIRIRSALEHPGIVVAFQRQKAHVLERIVGGGRDDARIRHEPRRTRCGIRTMPPRRGT